MRIVADTGKHIDFRTQPRKNTVDVRWRILKRDDLDLQLRPLFIDPDPVISDQIRAGNR